MATSPNARSRSTRQTRCPIPDRATARLVDTVVLPTPPLAEKTVTSRPFACSRVPGPLHGQGLEQRVSSSHGERETGEVSFLDHLAHSRSQRLGEHAGVHPRAEQDDAQRRTGHSQGVRKGDRRLKVDRWPEHDRELVRASLEMVTQCVDARDHFGAGPDGPDEQLGARRLALDDGCHDVAHLSRSCWVTPSSGVSFVPSPSRPKLMTSLLDAKMSRSASRWSRATVRIVCETTVSDASTVAS